MGKVRVKVVSLGKAAGRLISEERKIAIARHWLSKTIIPFLQEFSRSMGMELEEAVDFLIENDVRLSGVLQREEARALRDSILRDQRLRILVNMFRGIPDEDVISGAKWILQYPLRLESPVIYSAIMRHGVKGVEWFVDVVLSLKRWIYS